MSHSITVAAAQYPLYELPSLAAYRHKIGNWVDRAAAEGADILVFPEYAAMELSAIGDKGRDLQESIDAVSGLKDETTALHQDLARRHGVMIVAGSAPRRMAEGTFNVAQVFGPNGRLESVVKLMPTPWERSEFGIAPGKEFKVFDLGFIRVGVLICYDVEFPMFARAMAEAGAQVIVVPSNTETEWGYWRVRTGCAARALENQIYTVQSPCVGPAPFCTAVSNNVGMAAVFAPPDRGFPEDGVLAMGSMNKPRWVYAKLDLNALVRVRQAGSVRTFEHWREQPGLAALPNAKVIDLLAEG